MIPTRFKGTCHFCARELDTREPGVHQYVHGWVKNRQGGGGHGVSLPEREQRWAHAWCIDRLSSGTFGQEALFGASTLKVTEAPGPERKPAPTNASLDEGRLQHVCNVCGGHAPFGIGVALKEGDLGLWYCRAHLPAPE